MSELTKAVTDESFRAGRAGGHGPRAGGFLGRMVRPMPHGGPGPRRARQAEYAGKLTIAKVNIDENPMTPNEYAVRGIPTMILFRDGKPVDTKVGAMPKGQMKSWIAGAIGE